MKDTLILAIRTRSSWRPATLADSNRSCTVSRTKPLARCDSCDTCITSQLKIPAKKYEICAVNMLKKKQLCITTAKIEKLQELDERETKWKNTMRGGKKRKVCTGKNNSIKMPPAEKAMKHNTPSSKATLLSGDCNSGRRRFKKSTPPVQERKFFMSLTCGNPSGYTVIHGCVTAGCKPNSVNYLHH